VTRSERAGELIRHEEVEVDGQPWITMRPRQVRARAGPRRMHLSERGRRCRRPGHRLPRALEMRKASAAAVEGPQS
jgi:hypothetical protein